MASEDAPYSLLYANLASKDINIMFCARFEQPTQITDED